MDMRSEKWFSQLKVSGVGKPIEAHGSLITILGSVATQLKTLKGQKLSDGSIEIQLVIRELPFEGPFNSADSFLNKSLAVNIELDSTDMLRAPNDSESFEDYYQYLVSNDLGPISADAIAREHFRLEPDPDFVNWQTDPKAVRFRTLNSVQAEFDKALPSEYAELKHYIIHTYPKFCDSLTFRTA